MIGSCDLPTPPPTTVGQRLADRYRDLAGPVFRMPIGVLVAIGVAVAAGWLPVRAGMALDALFLLAIGVYCAANFWRCREAHCVITGTGWTAAGLAAMLAAVGGYAWNDALWIWFLIVWVVGLTFEFAVRRRTGSNVLP